MALEVRFGAGGGTHRPGQKLTRTELCNIPPIRISPFPLSPCLTTLGMDAANEEELHYPAAIGHNPSVGSAMKITIKRTLLRKVRKCREQAVTT